MLQEYYLCIAIRKFFFLLDVMQQKKIRIVDIVASRLLEEFEALNELSNNAEDDAECGETESQNTDALNWLVPFHINLFSSYRLCCLEFAKNKNRTKILKFR